MSRVIVAIAAMMCLMVGCASSDKDEAMTASADVCSHCPGVQTGTTDGKCEKCGMMMAGGDACTHCEGMQMAKTDGTCPVCNTNLGKGK